MKLIFILKITKNSNPFMDLYIYFFFLCIQYQNHFFLSYHKYRRLYNPSIIYNIRGGSKTAATFKVELFVIIVNGWIYPKYLTQQLKVVGLPKSSLKFLVEVCMNFCHHQTLTHYSPVLLFYTPWKHEKTCRFSDVFRGYRKKHRAVMD